MKFAERSQQLFADVGGHTGLRPQSTGFGPPHGRSVFPLTGGGFSDNVCFLSTGPCSNLSAVEAPRMSRFVRFFSLFFLAGSLLMLISEARAQTSVCPTTTIPDVTTWHNDNCRTGWQQNETILTPSALQTAGVFGLLWQYSLAGSVDAEPLAVSNLGSITNCSGNCSLVFIADEQDNLYAFDATTNTQIWATNVANSLMGTYVNCSFPSFAGSFPPCEENTPPGNTVGIMGTPVIDESDDILYAVGAVSLDENTTAEFYLFAVDILNGNVMASTQIQGTVQGKGPSVKCSSTYPNSNTISFDSGHVQRSALLLLSGNVYVAFSPGDGEWENGWIFGYSYVPGTTATLAQTVAFAPTPYGTGGGIWGSGAGPASDGTYIYAVTGNGTFDPPTGDPVDWGDSVLKLLPPSSGETFPVIDFYDPPDNLNYPPPNGSGLCVNDEDFGSGGIMVFPEAFYYDENLEQYVKLTVNADKQSKLYVIDRDNMRVNGTSGVQIFLTPPIPSNGSDPTQGYWNSPAYWKYWDSSNVAHYLLYYAASDGMAYPTAAPLPIYQYILPTSGSSGPLSTSQQGVDFNTTTSLFCRYSPTPSVSSTNNTTLGDGAVTGTGILWAIETKRNSLNPNNCNGSNEGAALHAFDATTLQELYNSANSLTSQLFAAHFNVPMIFRGRVYVGAAGGGSGNQVYVFGLCSEGPNGCVQPH